jgi:class 3 adenylate cyclase
MTDQALFKRRLAAILAADLADYSRLMSEDETGTVRDLKAHQAVVLPLIGRHGGRIIDTAGDGVLAEFPSVIGAAECAIEMQTIMAARNADVPASRRMLFRIGINLGDVIHDDGRIYGDGINVAARLEGMAEPGGICISRQVFDQVSRVIRAEFQALGPRTLKNIAQPVDVFAVPPPDRRGRADAGAVELTQEIRFCTAPDGVQLAYSMVGRGLPLVKTGNWMTHLEYDLESPIWRHLYRELARVRTLVRYDTRGNGLSDRRGPLIRRVRGGPRDGDRGRQSSTVRAVRHLPGLRARHRLRRPASGARLPPRPVRRVRDRPDQARADGGRAR